jgi:hypothetical protein
MAKKGIGGPLNILFFAGVLLFFVSALVSMAENQATIFGYGPLKVFVVSVGLLVLYCAIRIKQSL